MSEFIKVFSRTVGTCMLLLTLTFGIACSTVSAAHADAAPKTGARDTTTQVICNVILFVQNLGLPIMTGVILGASVMAIFGRLAWPAIAMLIVFTAIFFGASKIIAKFAGGISDLKNLNADGFECTPSTGG
ncbi:MAG: TrbC/VirB2 family protein [Anaplasma sp.]